MPTIASAVIPPPKSWDEFEDILLSTSKLRWKSTTFFRNGRQGQRQDGVDVFGQDDQGSKIGVQAKNTLGGISLDTVISEIGKAENFDPPLDLLCIATTAPRDATLQKAVRTLSHDRATAKQFRVEILFWDDVANDLSGSEGEFFKHYPQFAPKRNDPKEHDRLLFQNLTSLVTSAGVIHFVDETNMAFSFERARLDPLQSFVYVWGDAEHEFLYEPLDQLRAKLLDSAKAYLGEIAVNTFPLDTNIAWSSIPQDWEIADPKNFAAIVKRIHSHAEDIVAIHREIVRAGNVYLIS